MASTDGLDCFSRSPQTPSLVTAEWCLPDGHPFPLQSPRTNLPASWAQPSLGRQGAAPHPAASRPGGGAGLAPLSSLAGQRHHYPAVRAPQRWAPSPASSERGLCDLAAPGKRAGSSPGRQGTEGRGEVGATHGSAPPGDGSGSRFVMGLEQDPFTHPSAEAPAAAVLIIPGGLPAGGWIETPGPAAEPHHPPPTDRAACVTTATGRGLPRPEFLHSG
jgi:hypothetical protein